MTHSHPAADSHEIRGLTGIRGFAALMVVVYHFHSMWRLLFPALGVAERPMARGCLGVDLFFILSGFILSYVYHAGNKSLTLPDYGRFLWFRLARIYPNHFAMLLALVVLVTVAPLFGVGLTGLYAWDYLPFQLTLIHSWPIVPKEASESWNYPAWSISAEWFAYLAVFPIVALLLRWIRSSALALCLGLGGLAAWPLYFALVTRYQLFDGNHELVHVSCEFFAGGMFFSAFLLGSGVTRFCQRWLSGLFALLFVLFCSAPSVGIDIGILLVFALLLLGLTSEASLAARLLSTAPALWLGRVSYAIYMTHGIAQKLTKVLLPPARYADSPFVFRLLVVMADLALIFAMATALYYLVEVPARNYLRKIRPFWRRSRN